MKNKVKQKQMGTASKLQENSWKTKAITRSEENKALRKELKRQKKRSAQWREETTLLKKSLKQQGQALASQDLIISELSTNAVEKGDNNSLKDLSIGGYKFPLSVIWLSINLYKFV